MLVSHTAVTFLSGDFTPKYGGFDMNMQSLDRLCIFSGLSDEARPYGLAVGRGVEIREVAGVMVPAGNTPAPESGAAEAPGEL